MEKLNFVDVNGEEVQLFIVADVKLSGRTYILVTESEEGDGEADIFKDVSDPADPQGIYEPVEDEDEYAAVAKLFDEELDDIDLV